MYEAKLATLEAEQSNAKVKMAAMEAKQNDVEAKLDILISKLKTLKK